MLYSRLVSRSSVVTLPVLAVLWSAILLMSWSASSTPIVNVCYQNPKSKRCTESILLSAGESAGKAMSRIYGKIGFSGLWNG